MEKSLEQRSIFEATSACRRRLTECVSNPSLMADEWPRKRLADFNLWAHDSGALAKQRASLDRRLAEKHMVREVILNLLNLLEGLLTRCLSQTSEFAAHQDERTDLSETFEDVEDIMAQLVRISAAIRGAGIRARFERADDSFNLDRHIELKEYLEFLVLVASLDQVQKEQGNIDIILSGEITDIAQRLVLANLIRRHRYLYARRRWTKQAAQPETPTKPWIVPVAATLPEQVQPPPMPTAIPGNEGSESKPRVSEPSIITSTVPTAIQGPIQIPEGRQSSITAASSTSSRVVYPKPPKVSQDAMFFRCPCCFQTLPVAFTQHFRWRKHLGGDIQPYTCILKDCPKPLQLYVTRKEWTRHMREEHEVTKYWLCSACLDPTRFDVESHFRTHLQTQHEDVVLEDQIPTFVSMSTYMSPPSFTCCPLCPPQQDGEEVDTDALLNHTAEHVHSFSLQSLPWPIPEEGEREYLGLGPENLLDHFDFFDVASGPDSADGSPSSNSQDSHRTDETSNSLDLAFRDENPDVPWEPYRGDESPGNDKVAALLKAGEWTKALEVAKSTFNFAHKQGYYSDLSRVHDAYKLAEYMAGIDVQRPNDAKLREEFLGLSREITKEAFAILKAENIELYRLKHEDLSDIVRLLGSQQNYVELEALLLSLWQSREVQRTWNVSHVLGVGRMLVHAHVAADHMPAAIELCERMCYNLRRSHGALDPVTVGMQRMLAELYTADKRVDHCMAIHVQILHEIKAALLDYDEKESRDPIKYNSQPELEILAKTATWQFELLKRAYYRQGGFPLDEHEKEFADLYDLLQQRLNEAAAVADKKDICVLEAPPPATWAKSAAAIKDKPDDLIGMYVGPREKDWRLDGGNSSSAYFGEGEELRREEEGSGFHVNDDVARRRVPKILRWKHHGR